MSRTDSLVSYFSFVSFLPLVAALSCLANVFLCVQLLLVATCIRRTLSYYTTSAHKIFLCRHSYGRSCCRTLCIVAWLAGGWRCLLLPIVDESRSFDCFYCLRLYQLLHCTFLLIHILFIYACGLLWFLRRRFLLIKTTHYSPESTPLMIAS
jgi:hypothetical protein